jgi:plastocyanin
MRRTACAPAHAEVPVGSIATWTNEDDAKHDVVFDAGPGSYLRTFTTAGTFDYACKVHPKMRGSRVVRG